jgi:hypothetical protein
MACVCVCVFQSLDFFATTGKLASLIPVIPAVIICPTLTGPTPCGVPKKEKHVTTEMSCSSLEQVTHRLD